MKVKDIAIIIVHFKNVSNTIETLVSLHQATLPKGVKRTFYVVNNDQSKQLERQLLRLFPKVVYLYSTKNLGFTGGNNLGLNEALKEQHETFVLINNDVSVKKDFFYQITRSPIREKKVGIVGGLIYFASGFEFKKHYQKKDLGKVIWYAGGHIDWNNIYANHIAVDQIDNGQFDQPLPTDFVTGCLLITKRSVLEQIGLLNNQYFLYLEDVDFNVRAQRAGYQTIFDPNIKIWHKVAGSSAIGSPVNDYFLTRNRLLFAFKYAKFRTKFAIFREALKKIFTGTKAQKTAIKDFFTGKLGKGSWLR